MEFTICNLGGAGSDRTRRDHRGRGCLAVQGRDRSGRPLGHLDTTALVIELAPTNSGVKTATIVIASNDADENPFAFSVSGRALSVNEDSDTDGLNDVAEYRLSGLGFDWEVAQPDLVAVLHAGANDAGLSTPDQVQALHVAPPLIRKDLVTKEFTLTIGVLKSTTLEPGSFVPFPMTVLQTAVNGQGELEFRFSVPDEAAFFQLQAR